MSLCVVVFSSMCCYYLIPESKTSHICWHDLVADKQVCKPACSEGSFGLVGMPYCRPYLTCQEIEKLHIVKILARGVVKNVYLAEWQGHAVVVANLSDPRLEPDFRHNVRMHRRLHHPSFTVDHLGSCGNVLVTEYFELGSADGLRDLWAGKLRRHATAPRRLGLCAGYAAILAYLHAHGRVMCDSNWLLKALSQYLVRSDLSLRLNDMDALPVVAGTGAECGAAPLRGDLLAPEQRVGGGACGTGCDVWKIPDVCLWFLGHGRDGEPLKFGLFDVHRRCKADDPGRRPSARDVLYEYRRLLDAAQRNGH